MAWTKTASLVGAALLALACSSSDGGEGSGGSGQAGGSAGTGGVAGTAGEAGQGAGGTGGVAGAAPDFSVEVVLHESQPMVVDAVVSGPDALQADLALPSDPGARIGLLSQGENAVTYRLRGLAPDTTHELTTGAGQSVSFETLPAAAGFVGQFPVDIRGEASGELRMFDYALAPEIRDASIFVIEPTGRTRFHLGFPDVQAAGDLPVGLKLLPDGKLLFLQLGRVVLMDELGAVVGEIAGTGLGGIPILHHDVITLPNDRFLVIGVEAREIYYPDDDVTHYVAGDILVEFDLQGVVHWTWSAFDHLDPQRKGVDFDAPFYALYHPITGEQVKDWTHSNGVIYVPENDSLILCVRHQDWLVSIDRQSGDVNWKLGVDGDFSLPPGQSWFWHPHSPELQPDGSLLLYDNGNGDPTRDWTEWFSRPIRLELDEQAMTANIAWQDVSESYLSPIAGDVDLMANGNYLVLDSALPLEPPNPLPANVRLREIDPATGEWVWVLDSPDGYFSYRATPQTRLPGEAQ